MKSRFNHLTQGAKSEEEELLELLSPVRPDDGWSERVVGPLMRRQMGTRDDNRVAVPTVGGEAPEFGTPVYDPYRRKDVQDWDAELDRMREEGVPYEPLYKRRDGRQ